MYRRHRHMFCLWSVLLYGAFLLFCNNVLAQDKPYRILAFGDSLTAGYGLPLEDSFPVQLEAALRDKGYDVRVINGGVSGDTTAGGLSRAQWALEDDPNLVIIELGANDMLRGLSPVTARDNLSRIIETFRQNHVRVILVGMKAQANLGDEYAAQFDGMYPDLAEAHDITLYPFFLEGVALHPQLNQADGLHPTAEGVRVIVQKILPVIVAEMKKS